MQGGSKKRNGRLNDQLGNGRGQDAEENGVGGNEDEQKYLKDTKTGGRCLKTQPGKSWQPT